MGHSPKRVLAWGPRRDTRPAGERRSGGALGGCLSHRDSNPTWSEARDAAYAQKERPAGEAYRSSPCGDSATPPGDHKLSLARQTNSLRLRKSPLPPGPPQISRIKYINPQFVKIPYACACARARAAACALGCAREVPPQKLSPREPAKTAPFPREAPAKNRKIKIFQKNLPKQAGICRPDCVLY